MPIVFRCLQCQKTLRVGDDAAGKKARCPDCGTVQDVVPPGNLTPVLNQESAAPINPFAPQHDANPFSSSVASNPFSETNPASNLAGQSSNPYAAPLQPGQVASQYSQLTFLQRRQIAESKVKGPALAMIVVQLMVVVLSLFQLIAVFAQNNRGQFEVAFPLVQLGISLGFSLLIFFGAWQMYRVRGYPWAMAAAILSAIPCGGCCILSLPVGIWALIVLNDSVVKSAFD